MRFNLPVLIMGALSMQLVISLGLFSKPKASLMRKELESRFVGGNSGAPSAEKDSWVGELEALSSPIEKPGLRNQYGKVANGLWRVSHAPHIRNLLQPLLFTDFDVFYELQDGEMFSFVKFNFKPIGLQGHLCTYGTYAEVDEATTTIEWDRVWFDFDPDRPSKREEVDKHVLPMLIQAIGKRAFVKGVSVFPVSYLSDKVIVFTFQLLGTRIVASKLDKKQADFLMQ